ncbi:YheC/YheD family protein [Paenibacillus alginolyticus]|uniref:YheC/YheD family protein n=1 Tax=Paenibacillus alginolyticus TaxID=59839 RepID=A0ABT4G6W8_9BACL|nr:YheC/YheD family protein [Paenibacillus alginolyticus]MCY9663567.1 YheC/YheD family protein [Paenibacillus alginolyticus]MCY9691925.1 YheC/YheD family protein [Paenibacillus alginolyticus]MEC0144115.1 YheC/YheD family protein [Paenibacillus alginolyticus]
MSSKRLGVLAIYLSKSRLEELSYFQRLSKEGKKLGVQVEVFTPDDVEGDNAVRTLTYDSGLGKWIRKRTSFPPVIYDRCRYKAAANYQMLKAFRNRHAKLIYLSKPLANKWSMHQILSENESIRPYLPATVRFSSVQDLLKVLKKHKLIYVKPKNGTGGRGILRIEQLGSDLYLLQGRNQQRTIIAPFRATEKQLAIKLHTLKLSPDYVVQQGIHLTLRDGRVHDYRLLIQKNGNGEWEVTGCAGRIGPQRSITSNLHGGGSAVTQDKLLAYRFSSEEKMNEIKKEMNSFAFTLANYLETKFGKLCELGMDIAVDPKGHVWLLEVNPKPSREVFRKIGQHSIYQKAVTRPLEYAVWMMKQKRIKREEQKEQEKTEDKQAES